MNKTAFALAVAITATTSSALAAPAVETPPSIRVSFADLDLSEAAGRATLERRVGHAVRTLCELPYSHELGALSVYSGCRSRAWAGARVQLAAVYQRSRYAASGPMKIAAK